MVARTQSGAPTALLERAMDILGCFNPKRAALTLSELAELTKLPV